MVSARLVILLASSFGAAVAPNAIAQEPATRPASRDGSAIEAAYLDLAAADPARRHAARTALMGLSRDELPALADAVKANLPAGPAQAVVLRDVVTHVHCAGEPYETIEGQGFLGLSGMAETQFVDPAEPDVARPAVTFAFRIPGFAAYRWLADGDVIVAHGPASEPVTTFGDFQRLIASTPPGTPLSLRVLRGGQLIDVTLSPSPRPAYVGVRSGPGFEDMAAARLIAADGYWREHFAPLIDPNYG